ncbi:MAG: 2Fe-2S iron-sulfur cluster-binding protein [Colwellia sp.]|nr:2Fe-2S iron-sulfur cluster-binding protein [Colwellia sp.]
MGVATRTCIFPVSAAISRKNTNVEGVSPDNNHAVQQAWQEFDVPQCGYCQSGQIMAATAFLASNPNPTDEDIDGAMSNICRCGTYLIIRKAIHRSAEIIREGGQS